MTEDLLLKPFKTQFVQQLHEEDFQDVAIILTELTNKNNVYSFVWMK